MRFPATFLTICSSFFQSSSGLTGENLERHRSSASRHQQNLQYTVPFELGQTLNNRSGSHVSKVCEYRDLNNEQSLLNPFTLRSVPTGDVIHSDIHARTLSRRAIVTKDVESNMKLLRNDRFENERMTKIAAKAKEKAKPGGSLQESLVGKSQEFKQFMEETSTRDRRTQLMRWTREEHQRYMLEVEGLRKEGRTELADDYKKVIDAWWSSWIEMYDSANALRAAFKVRKASASGTNKDVGSTSKEMEAKKLIKPGSSGGNSTKVEQNSRDRLQKRSFAGHRTDYNRLHAQLFLRTLSKSWVDEQIEANEKLTQSLKQLMKGARKQFRKHREAGTVHLLEKAVEEVERAAITFKNSEAATKHIIAILRKEGRIDEANRYQDAVETKMF